MTSLCLVVSEQFIEQTKLIKDKAMDMNQRVRSTAMWCHLSALPWVPAALIWLPFLFVSFLAPLIVWSSKKQEHSFIDENGKESLNFRISTAVYLAVFVVLAVLITFIGSAAKTIFSKEPYSDDTATTILALFVVGAIFLVLIVGLIQFILTIVASIKANNGQTFRYPLTIRFLK